MFITRIPVYYKIVDTPSRQGFYSFVCDSSLYNRVITLGTNYTWDDLHETDPATLVNNFLGGGLLNTRLPFVCLKRTTDAYNYGPYLSALAICNIDCDIAAISDNATQTSAGYYEPEYIKSDNNYDLEGNMAGTIYYNGGGIAYIRGGAITSSINQLYVSFDGSSPIIRLEIYIYPDDILTNAFNDEYQDAADARIEIELTLRPEQDSYYCKKIKITSTTRTGSDNGMKRLKRGLGDYVTKGSMVETDDMDNPYGDDGNSNPGGGDGTLPPGGLDSIDPTEVPDFPTISAATTGFITLYNPSSSAVSNLGSFLWSSMFDPDTFKKLFTDPMDCIISLGIVPCVPAAAGQRNIMLGNVDTGVSCQYLSSQFVKVNCGSVDIQKYVGSFMDYSPYVKINLFLPYIGFVHLGTDDIMGGSINVTYNVDVLSGDAVAFISHSSKGVLYSYSGNCLVNVPITSQNYASALKNYYESITGIIPSTVNGAMSGGAAGAVAGAASGALNAASNIVLNSKPTYQRSGNIGGPAGLMGVQKPFIIIERPNISVPLNIQNYVGQTSNLTRYLGECSGFTMVEYIHLHGIPATSEELREIEGLLKGGVIL